MTDDRLTPLDASFLHLEDARGHMHVACAMVFDGEPPPYDELVAHVDARMNLVPRYRQRLAWVPLGQGRPKWVDDEDFDLRYHVRVTALPSPGSEDELRVLAGRVFSVPLNRDRPLWEMWLVEGMRGGRFAILSKTHHALVDGISGLDILSVLFAPEDESDGADARGWTPRPAPSGAELLAEALTERLTSRQEILRPVRALMRRPGKVVAGLGAMARAGLSPAPASPFNRTHIGRERRFTWVRAELADLKAIKNELGGTVNDVVLAVVTGALRRYLLRAGESVDGVVLKAFVPVSVRSEDEQGTLGNQVAGMMAPLDVGCADPVRCLRGITEAMQGLKESGQAVGAQALTELMGFAPPTIMDQAARLTARQRFLNLVVTNVPGPQFPLHLGQRELLDIFPMVPLGKNLALGVAILSYNGGMNFGLVGDFDAMPDLEDLANDFREALGDLAATAAVKLPDSDAQPEPWPGYDQMSAARIVRRLAQEDGRAAVVVGAYERTGKARKTVLQAARRT